MTNLVDLEHIWRQTRGTLRSQMSKANYTALFTDTILLSLDGDLAVIQTTNDLISEWLERRYYLQVQNSLHAVTNITYQLRFVSAGENGTEAYPDSSETTTVDANLSSPAEVKPGVYETDMIKDRGTLSKKDKSSAKTINFLDTSGKGYRQHPHYDATFQRIYLSTRYRNAGVAAFSLHDYICSQFRDFELPWTPVLRIDPEDLAKKVASRQSGQIITGVWRKCPHFKPGQCCDQKPDPRLSDDGCRYWVMGALDILVIERMAAVERRGTGPRNIAYFIQIYRKWPYLTLKQAGYLNEADQLKHAIWLREERKYREWLKRTEENFLFTMINLEGLELKLP